MMTTSKDLGSLIDNHCEDDVVDGIPFRSTRPKSRGAAPPHMMATMSRSAVEVTTKNNQVYEGVYATFDKTTGEILLQAAYKKEPSNSGDKEAGPPVVYDVLSISNKNVLLMKQINAEDLKVEESRVAARQGGGGSRRTESPPVGGFATDTAISGGGGSRGGLRKLEPAPAWLCSTPGEASAQLTLDDEAGDGKSWEAKDMFKKNEQKYGVVSTFREDLTGYTTKVDRSKADFKKMEDEANRIEKQIRHGRRGGGASPNSYGPGQYRPRMSPTAERNPRAPRGGGGQTQGQGQIPRPYPTRQFINSRGHRFEGAVSAGAAPRKPNPPQSPQIGSSGGVKANDKLESGGGSAGKTSKPLADSRPSAPTPKSELTPAEKLKALVAGAVGKTEPGSKGGEDEVDCGSKKKASTPPRSGFQPNIKAKEFQPAGASPPKQLNPNAKVFNPSSFAPRQSPSSSQAAMMTSPQAHPHGHPVYSLAPMPILINQGSPHHYSQAPSYSTTTTSAGGGGGHWIGMSLLGTQPGGLEMSRQHQHQHQPMQMSVVGAGAGGGPPILSSVSRFLAPPQFVASQEGTFSVIRVMPPTSGPILFQPGAAQEAQMRPGSGFR